MSNRTLTLVSMAIKAFCFTVIMVTTFIFIMNVGPTLETRYFPVVGKLQILKTEWRGPEVTRIWAAFTKIRNCKYIGIAWYKREGLTFTRIPVIVLREIGDESSPNRPVGSQKAGPWDVFISTHQLRTESFAELSHRCHPLWTTTTEFFP